MVFRPKILHASAISTMIDSLRQNAPHKSVEMADIVTDNDPEFTQILDHMSAEEKAGCVGLIEKAYMQLASELEEKFEGVHEAHDGQIGYRLSMPQFKTYLEPAWQAAMLQCVDSILPEKRTDMSKQATGALTDLLRGSFEEGIENMWNQIVEHVEKQGIRRE